MHFSDEPEHVRVLRTTVPRFAEADVPPDLPGVCIHPIEHANFRYTLSCKVIFEDVEVPIDVLAGSSSSMQRNSFANRLGLASEEAS